MNQTYRYLIGGLTLAALSLAAWWAWLGWDTEYQVDPATGQASGPYTTAQVVACVLTIVVIAAVGGMLVPPWIVVPAMTIPFTVAWAVQAATTDDSGLWVVGAVLLTGGMTAGTAACSFTAHALSK